MLCWSSADCKQCKLGSPNLAANIETSIFTPVRPKFEGRSDLNRAKRTGYKDYL